MPTTRELQDLAEFFRFTKIGQSVLGRIDRFFKNDKGTSMILEPVIIYQDDSDGGMIYGNVAIGLATDLRYKIAHDPEKGKTDAGQWVRITYTGDKKVPDKPSPKKLFRLDVYAADEMDTIAALSKKANNAHRSDPFKSRSEMSSRDDDADDDGLPF